MNVTHLVVCLALLLPLSSQAGLIEVDYSAAGDTLITRDLDNSLDWLDVSITAGQSITDALATYATQGFRLATDQELVSLYISAGVDEVLDYNYGHYNPIAVHGSNTQTWNVTSVMGRSALSDLYDMLGGGNGNFGGNQWVHGYLEDHDQDGLHALGRLIIPQSTYYSSSVYAAHVNTNADNWSKTRIHDAVGSFLVRDAATDVPEPATFALFGIGLLCLFTTRRKLGSQSF